MKRGDGITLCCAAALLLALITGGCGESGGGGGGTQVQQPEITQQPQDLTVNEGETATFSVTVTGSAPLSYQWQRSDDGGSNWYDIQGATSDTYSFTAQYPADNGAQFRCVVSNAAGSVESNAATLTVTESQPIILENPEHTEVYAGQTATFTVVATGSAPLSYQWQIAESEAGPWNSIPDATDAVLSFTATLDLNEKYFRCAVSNDLGTTYTLAAKLWVIGPPEILEQPPANIAAQVGETIYFGPTCKSGLWYQWERSDDGGNTWTTIQGATSIGYQITVQASDDGAMFRCIVSNPAGSVTSEPTTITVIFPPGITAQPQDQSAVEGQTATFSVTATGYQLSYQWQHKPGEYYQWTDIANATEPTLTITAQTPYYNGSKFRCIVSNPAGTVTSSEATLTIFYPPKIMGGPVNVTVLDGQQASFWVDISGSSPLSYQWQRWNSSTNEWDDISGATESVYSFIAQYPADNGAQFRCKVSNPYGEVTSEAATLTVNPAPPQITQQPANQTLYEGNPVSFSVTATGTQPLYYQWQRSNNYGSSWNDISGANESTYTLETTSPADNGAMFRCVVSNVAAPQGVASQPATLGVLFSQPIITQQPASTTVPEGQTATFSVTATGSAPISYQWQRWNSSSNEWNDISDATESVYSFTATLDDNGAQFRCKLSNNRGTTLSNAAMLTVLPPPPQITQQPQSAEVSDGDTVEFSVTATSPAPMSYQWQRWNSSTNEWDDISGATSPTYSFTAQLSDNGAQFRCKVSNSGGSVESEAATLTVNPTGPTIIEHPEDRTVPDGTKTAFSVRAKGTQPLYYQWQRSNDGGNTWFDLDKENSDFYGLTAQMSDNGSKFRCKVWNAWGEVTSNAATLTVTQQ